jgi:DNA-directed RNA polymerase specialized sigma24 family protein
VRSYERATSVTAAINNMFTRLLDGTRAMLWGEDYRCYAERVNVYRSEVTVNRLSQDVAQDVCLAVLTALDRYQLKGLSFTAFVCGIGCAGTCSGRTVPA